MNINTNNDRVLKFRIWSKIASQWDEADYLECSNGGILAFFGGIGDNDNYIIQQFTGLKDIEGKEIYEGDLVQMRYANQPEVKESFGVYEVYYDTRWAAFYLKIIKKNWFDGVFLTEKEAEKQTIDPICPVSPKLTSPLGDFRICEVIGNIFENPELLKS